MTLVVDKVKLLLTAVLLLSTKLPVPVTPPLTVKVPAVSVKVVPLLLTVRAPVTLNAEVPFCVRPVTLEPIAALIKVAPAPLPLLVIVPVLLTLVVESVKALLLLLLSVRLALPVTPPVKLKVLPVMAVKVASLFKVIAPVKEEMAAVLLPIVCVPLLPACTVMARAIVKAPPVKSEALALPEVLPNKIALLALPSAPLVLTAALPPTIKVPPLMVVVPL